MISKIFFLFIILVSSLLSLHLIGIKNVSALNNVSCNFVNQQIFVNQQTTVDLIYNPKEEQQEQVTLSVSIQKANGPDEIQSEQFTFTPGVTVNRKVGPFDQAGIYLFKLKDSSNKEVCSQIFTVVSSTNGGLNVSLEKASLKDNQDIKVNYQGAIQKACLVIRLNRKINAQSGTYVRPKEPGLSEQCYSNDDSPTVYNSFLTPATSGFFGIEAQPAADYELTVTTYTRDCVGIGDFQRCGNWEIRQTSNMLPFSVGSSVSTARYQLTINLDPGSGTTKDDFKINTQLRKNDGTQPQRSLIIFEISEPSVTLGQGTTDDNGNLLFLIPKDKLANLKPQEYEVQAKVAGASEVIKASSKLIIKNNSDSTTKRLLCTGNNCTSAAGIICDVNDATLPKKGEIINPPPERTGILTAIGCVPTDPKMFLEKSLPVVFGASGGVAFLLMIMGAFQMITSAGNPDNLKKGREQFNSAIIGLLFILFSVLLLQIVGFNILNIPGFGK